MHFTGYLDFQCWRWSIRKMQTDSSFTRRFSTCKCQENTNPLCCLSKFRGGIFVLGPQSISSPLKGWLNGSKYGKVPSLCPPSGDPFPPRHISHRILTLFPEILLIFPHHQIPHSIQTTPHFTKPPITKGPFLIHPQSSLSLPLLVAEHHKSNAFKNPTRRDPLVPIHLPSKI